ncbi:hypothetical protein EDD15DRAFT_2459468 [Pisolithus albus]|nr:hypothetical protein EDD15DRAFT_2459468 [Pisolithus albus]
MALVQFVKVGYAGSNFPEHGHPTNGAWYSAQLGGHETPLDYTFDTKLKVDPRGRKVLLTEPPTNPKANRQRMVQVMFEEYGFQGVYVAIQTVLTLYAEGLNGEGWSRCLSLTRDLSLDPNLTQWNYPQPKNGLVGDVPDPARTEDFVPKCKTYRLLAIRSNHPILLVITVLLITTQGLNI